MTSDRDTTGLPFEQPSRDLLGRGFDDLAISDVEDATSDARNPSVMGDNDYGLLEISIQPLEQIQDFLAGLRVELSCGLVRKEQGWIVRQGDRDGDPLLLAAAQRSEEHTSELQSRVDLVCRLLLEKKKKNTNTI